MRDISYSWHTRSVLELLTPSLHDDAIKWKPFTRYWPFVRGIHRSPVNSPHIGQWRGALMFSLICARINGWVNNGVAGDLRRHRTHHDVTVMPSISLLLTVTQRRINQSYQCKYLRKFPRKYGMLMFTDKHKRTNLVGSCEISFLVT